MKFDHRDTQHNKREEKVIKLDTMRHTTNNEIETKNPFVIGTRFDLNAVLRKIWKRLNIEWKTNECLFYVFDGKKTLLLLSACSLHWCCACPEIAIQNTREQNITKRKHNHKPCGRSYPMYECDLDCASNSCRL